jgi:hypothetical protein
VHVANEFAHVGKALCGWLDDNVDSWVENLELRVGDDYCNFDEAIDFWV